MLASPTVSSCFIHIESRSNFALVDKHCCNWKLLKKNNFPSNIQTNKSIGFLLLLFWSSSPSFCCCCLHCNYCTAEGYRNNKNGSSMGKYNAISPRLLTKAINDLLSYLLCSKESTVNHLCLVQIASTLWTLATIHKNMSQLNAAPASLDSRGWQCSGPRQFTVLWGLWRPRQEASQRALESNWNPAPSNVH